MERTVKEVHGSLQVTLPKELARETGIKKGMRVRFEAMDSGILLRTSRPEGRVLWTIGYEGQTPDSFVAELSKRGIDHLVDIRDLPLSRRRGFSKTALASKLAEARIAYSHVKALGAPAPVRKPFIAGGPFAAFRDAYLKHLKGAAQALDSLASQAQAHKTAIMCVEHIHSTCHRQFVAQALAERGFEIRHVQTKSLA